MSGFDVYKKYLAIKLHFTTSYDYKKYNGQISKNITIEAFEKKPFRFIFKKLSKKRDYLPFLIAVLSENPNISFDELTSSETEKRYVDWKKRMQSLSRFFSQELKKLPDDYDLVLKADEYVHPGLLISYLKYDVSFETLCILLSISETKKVWDKIIKDIIWNDLSLRVDKYTPFISYDINKMKAIAFEKFQHPSFKENNNGRCT